jgi:hypothetical protein
MSITFNNAPMDVIAFARNEYAEKSDKRGFVYVSARNPHTGIVSQEIVYGMQACVQRVLSHWKSGHEVSVLAR